MIKSRQSVTFSTISTLSSENVINRFGFKVRLYLNSKNQLDLVYLRDKVAKIANKFKHITFALVNQTASYELMQV